MSDDDSTTMDGEESREQGVEFGGFEETIEDDIDYPIDNDELIEQYGDAEFELGDETTTLAEILEPLQDDDQTYQDAGDIETMIMNFVGDDAIGRKNYSDRTPYAPGEERQDEAGEEEGHSDQDSF
ncbi:MULTISPECIES: DUF5789 family protein [Saliphagus]|uniref:Uncharacterized protein n=1 Tax=Saliphagus infecundisoli TaxID=1849069 RepID=A0ABD5QB75_9EURY|nr:MULTISPECIES: hypothetical protein [Saliphagus]